MPPATRSGNSRVFDEGDLGSQPAALTALWNSREGIERGLVKRTSSLRVDAVANKNQRRVSFQFGGYSSGPLSGAPSAPAPALSAMLDSAETAAAMGQDSSNYSRYLKMDEGGAYQRKLIRKYKRTVIWVACVVLLVIAIAYMRRSGDSRKRSASHLHRRGEEGSVDWNGTSLVVPVHSNVGQLPIAMLPAAPSYNELAKRAEIWIGIESSVDAGDPRVTISAERIQAELSNDANAGPLFAANEAQEPAPQVGIASSTFDDPSFTGNYTSDPATWHADPNIHLPRSDGTVVLTADGMSPDAWDNTDGLLAGIDSCRRAMWNGNPCVLQPPRAEAVYRFRDRTVAFAGLQDFTFDGLGSTLLFARTQSYSPLLQIDTCTRCKFANFFVDWDWTVSRLATVARVGWANSRSWFLTFPPNQPIPDPSKTHGWISMHSLDQQRWSMGARDKIDGWFGLPERIAAVYRQGDGIRLDFHSDVWPVPEADLFYLMRHWSYEVPGFWLERCIHCSFDGIHLVSTPGKAMVFNDGSHSLQILRSKFAPREQPVPFQSDRFISMTVDGLFFAKTFGRILVEDVEIGWIGDDCINVHDPVGVGLRRSDWNAMVVGHSPGWRMKFAAGDKIVIRNPDWSLYGFEAVVTAAWQSSGVDWTVVVDRALPDFSRTDASRLLVVNLRWSASDMTIRRLWCHDNRARGVLIQIPNVKIDSCLFSDIQMSGIRITASAFWGEGTAIRNAAITNCTFRNVDKMNLGYGAVWTNLEWDESGHSSDYSGHENLVIEGNTIDGVPARAFTLQSANGISIKGNRVINGQANEPRRWDRGQIFMEKSRRVEVVDNSWTGGFNTEHVIAGGGEGVGGARNLLVR